LTRSVYIEKDSGSRRVETTDFPLTLGGADADIPLPGIPSAEPVALIGAADDGLFIQSQGSEPVVCNGTPVSTSQWLQDDDIVRIGTHRVRVRLETDRARLIVEGVAPDGDTEPPVVIPRHSAVTDGEAGEKTIRPIEFKPGGLAGRKRRRFRVRPAAVVLWVSLPVLAFVGWYLLTARAVEIVVEPPPDHVEIVNRPFDLPLELGGRHLLRQGVYGLVADKEGYERLDTTFEVSAERNQSHRFELRKLPGLLVVETVDGVEVVVDGAGVGITPLDPVELSPGEHAIRIVSERYREWETTVNIEGRGSTETLIADLIPLWATVSFDSIPRGATVTVDGEPIGSTPLTAELLEGRHRIEWGLRGHKTRRRTVEVAAGEPLTVPPARLQVVDGRLVIRSEPAGATVTVNDVYQGQTPLDLYLEPGSGLVVEVTKVGHETRAQTVTVEPGTTRTLEITLAPRVGEVEIRAFPADAQLLIDGIPRGDANQTLSLVAVPHQIEVRREGYESHRATVVPKPGVPQSLEIRLKTPDRIQAERTPAMIRTSQGQEMVLVEGGSFKMGASRREPGRRANETIREVELTRKFYIATLEVSNREFREFKPQHLSGAVDEYNLEYDHHPAVRVTWEEAALYCNWLSRKDSLPPAYEIRGGQVVAIRPPTTGYRLPTEAEWAWVARFGKDGESTKYPWGDTLPVEPGSGNYADQSVHEMLEHSIAGYDDGFPTTAPVKSFSPNARGISNLGGNVAEWVHDVYTIYGPSEGPTRDPVGPEDGEFHVIRGSSWMDSSVSELRLTYRDYGNKPRPDVGFRIARYAE
jgi:formylglycine-generating enzyme required for sulfatase activity